MPEKYELQYVIKGDASGMRSANAELQKFDKNISKVGSGKQLTGLMSSLSGVATGSQLNGLTSQITSASGALSAIPGPAGLAVGAIALLGTAAIGAGVAMYGLAKSASDYGSEIYDASQKTGLSAETLTSMKLAAEQSSSSLEEVTGAVTKFSRLVGDAALGSEEAAAKLTRLGIEPQKAIKDLDGALGDVFKRINALPPGVNQAKAATDAFGKSGAALLPFIKSFNGDLPGLIAKAKELGVTLSDDDARAADEFGDQMDTLNAQLKMVGVTFGQELMPVFLKGAEAISDWLSENKGEVKSWGKFFADAMTGAASAVTFTAGVVDDQADTISGAIETMTFGLANLETLLNVITLGGHRSLQQARAEYNTTAQMIAGRKAEMDAVIGIHKAALPGGGFTGESDYLANIEDQKKSAEKAQKEREAIAKRDAAAQVGLLKNLNDRLLTEYQSGVDRAKEILEKGGSFEGFMNALDAATDAYNANIGETIAALDRAENQVAELGKKTAKEWELHDAEQLKRHEDNNEKAEKIRESGLKALSDAEKKAADDTKDQREKAFADAMALTGAYYDNKQAIADRDHAVTLSKESDHQKRLGALVIQQMEDELALMIKAGKTENEIAVKRQEIATQKVKNSKAVFQATEKETEAVQDLADAIDELDAANRRLEAEGAARRKAETTVGSSSAKSAMAELHDVFVGSQNTAAIAGVDALTTAFDGLGQAIGSVVESWILYGNAGQSVRQITAQILAGVAQQAAVKAVFELAEGFAMLALAMFGGGTGPSAAAHFQAAAIYGSIAGIAALAGRAVAGDSFNQSSAGGTSSSSAGAPQGPRNSPPSTYTRTSPDAYMSGNRRDDRLADAIDRFITKFDPVSPGKVLMSGIRQAPDAVGNALVNSNARNPSIGKKFLKDSGIK